VLILVLLPVSFIAVMFYVGYLISLTHLCFIVFLSLYVRIDVLIYSARVSNKLTYLLTYLLTVFLWPEHCKLVTFAKKRVRSKTYLWSKYYGASELGSFAIRLLNG